MRENCFRQIDKLTMASLLHNPPPLFKPLTLCSFSLPGSVLRISFLSIIHQRSAKVGKFVFTYLRLSGREDFQVLTSPFVQNKKDRLHFIFLVHHFYKLQDHFNMEYRTINLSHSPFMHGTFLFES